MTQIARYVAAIIILNLAIFLAERAGAGCKQPELESFLEDSRAVLNYHGAYFPAPQGHWLPFRIVGGTLAWLGVGWEGPKGGALFVLDCEGQRLAATPLGYVSELRVGPTLPIVGATVQVTYSPGAATNYKIERIAIFALQTNTLKILWSHTVYEGPVVLPNDDGMEEEYNWRISDDGKEIRVDGFQSIYRVSKKPDENWGPPKTRKLPAETYCWNAATITYVRCAQSGQE
jgi:hypothetical protein